MFIPRPDATLFAQSFGSGPDTLLALGGWTVGGEVWHDVFGLLPGWRCVSMDHRGAGASRRAPGPITVAQMADDLLAVADAMGVGRCVLAAESSGCAVALEAALRQPRRFAGLVLCAPGWKRPPAAATEALLQALRQDAPRVFTSFVDRCLPETDSADLRRRGLQMVAKASWQDAAELVRSRATAELAARLPALQLPALVLHGTLDTLVAPGDAQELADLLPQARLHWLAGIGHAPMLTAADTLAQEIERQFGTAWATHAEDAPAMA